MDTSKPQIMAAVQRVNSDEGKQLQIFSNALLSLIKELVFSLLLQYECRPRKHTIETIVVTSITDRIDIPEQRNKKARMIARSLPFEQCGSKAGHLSSFWNTPEKTRAHNKNRANMQKTSSWITVMTFPWCLLLSNYRPYSSLCNEQRSSFSIWLALLGMLNFTAFLSSLFLMVICGAHFTRLHVITALLLISAMLITMDILI